VRNSLKVGSNALACGLSAGLTAGLVGAVLIGSSVIAWAECKPNHFRAPYFIRTMGRCNFDSETLSFRGMPAQQAMCLMRGMDATRNLGPTLEGLPPGLAKRVGESSGLPSRETLSAYLSKLDLEWDFAMYLWQPISRAHDNDPDAPMAKYFVIHDTSGPNYGHRAFPDDINTTSKINNLKTFVCNDEWGKAHVVINRLGDSLLNHDFSIPWRETKFEQAAEFGGALKGLFVHVEMIQPRRAGAGGGDGHSPDPAFTPAQYDRLALVYTVTSVRAGHWLIPAFHAALDADIRNGHDDPLNFKVESFADSIDRLMEQLQGAGQYQASNATTASDAQPDVPAVAREGFWIDAMWGTPHKVVMPPPAVADNPPNLNIPGAGDNSLPPAQAATLAAPAAPSAAGSSAAGPSAAATSAAGPSAAGPNAASVAAVKSPAADKPAARELAAREKVAARESESAHKQKAAETCTTHRVKGHVRRVCEPDRTAAHEHGKGAVRAADRGNSEKGTARHRGSESHLHHAGASPRHRRS